MDQQEIHSLALGLKNCGTKFAVAVTGGGAPVASSLFVLNGEGGASSFMHDFQIPYSQEAALKIMMAGGSHRVTNEGIPSVSLAASRSLAHGLWASHKHSKEARSLCTVAFTGKLTYPGERVGREHEAYITGYRPYFGAWLIGTPEDPDKHRPEDTFNWRLSFPTDSNRIDQELICSEAVVRVMRYLARVDKNPARLGLALQLIA